MQRAAFTLRDGHQIELLTGSRQLFPALIEAMARARSEIRLETYIFDFSGGTGQVAEALMQAARRGVETCVLVDGFGTGELPPEWLQRFQAAGVECRVYSPLGMLGLLGLLSPGRWRRLHRKLCVVDGDTAFCGGINILDDFHDPGYGPQTHPRLDFAVRVSGPLVRHAQVASTSLWWRTRALHLLLRRSWLQPYRLLPRLRRRRPRWATFPRRGSPLAQTVPASLLLRDNLRHRHDIERAYLAAIDAARSEIVIANAYFLPGRKLRQALTRAAGRGVKVRLLLQGRYEYFMQFHAARPVLAWLLQAGIEVHEYHAGFLHAKVAVMDAGTDHSWATVGSSNLDPLSLLLAKEANVVVRDAAFADALREQLEDAMAQHARQLSAVDCANRPWPQRMLDRLALGLMRLMLYITGRKY